MLLSIAIHILLLLIVLAPLFDIPPKKEEIAGILVSFGSIDEVSDTTSDTAPPAPSTEDSPTEPARSPPPVAPPAPKTKPAATATQDVNPVVAEVDKSAAQAEQAAIAKAEQEQKERAAFNRKKNQFGDLLSGGSTASETPGSKASPQGAPDAAVLEELSSGSGDIGGGLSDRGLVYEPPISDDSQQTGRVVMDVCVDAAGTVIEARFTQKGSTTTASNLVAIAKKAALQYRFTPSETDKQCGTIKMDFKVQ